MSVNEKHEKSNENGDEIKKGHLSLTQQVFKFI